MTNQTATLKQLVNDGVLSQPYASQITTGKRKPSQSLAIKIYRRTGMKLGPIAHASDAEIDTLEKVAKRVTQ